MTKHVVVLGALLLIACGSGRSPTEPASTRSLQFAPGIYQLSVDWQSGPGTVSLCIGTPDAATGFVVEMAMSRADGEWRLQAPNGSGANSGTMTGELVVNGTAVSGRLRGWAIDSAMRRVELQPPPRIGDALVSGTGEGSTASGEFSGSFSVQAPGGPTVQAACTPLGWKLAPR